MAVVPINTFVGKPLTPFEELQRLKTDRHLADLEIDELGIQIIPPVNTKAELGWNEPNALIKIPYWGVTGEKLLDNRGNQLSRYRRTVVNAKGERYTQARGSGARHYLPRLNGLDWNSIAKDVSQDVYYTEGEFKAIAGCKGFGAPCIGNAGVSAWRGADGKLAAPLDRFEWKGRNVYIVYDAEATSTRSVPLKANVSKALGELAVDLSVRGAVVQSLLIARTLIFVEGTKCGLDDYFSTGGNKEDLLKTAVTPEIDEDWWRMFDTYAVYIGAKPHILNIKTNTPYTARDFREMIETGTRVQDGKPTKLADLYREHDTRNWFNKYVFDPSLPPGFLRDEHRYNTWQGFAIEPNQSANYGRHVADFLAFTEGVFGSSNKDYYLDWAAHLLQKPGELTTISPILVSRVKGVGKSLTGSILRAIIGTRSSFVASVEGLTEKHTGELEGKLFAQVDEADSLFEGKENRLKALDSDEIRIRKMATDGYTVRNIMRKFYTTNENAAFRIAADERRYWVIRVNKSAADGEPGAPWNTWLREVVVEQLLKSPEALADIAWFLMNRDLEHWDPTAHVPRTEAMMDMVEAGMSKKHVMADQLYASLAEIGVWAVDSTINGIDNKLWGEVKAILRDNGGRVVQHTVRLDSGVKNVSVCMAPGHLLETIDKGDNHGSKLAPNQLSGADIKQMLLKTRKLLDEVRQLVDSSKY